VVAGARPVAEVAEVAGSQLDFWSARSVVGPLKGGRPGPERRRLEREKGRAFCFRPLRLAAAAGRQAGSGANRPPAASCATRPARQIRAELLLGRRAPHSATSAFCSMN
jgi:hypothetical protein